MRRLSLAASLILLFMMVSDEASFGRAGGGGGYNSGSGGGSNSDSGWVIDIIYMLVRLIIWKPAVGIPVAIIVCGVIYYIYSRGDSVWGGAKADWGNYEEPAPKNVLMPELHRLKARDPGFDELAFKKKVRDTFLAVQKAWSARSLERIRPLVSDGVQERFEILLEMHQRWLLRNVMKDVTVTNVHLRCVKSDAHFDTIEVKIEASAVDYFERTDTRARVDGADAPERFVEYWSFLRRPKVRTKPGAKGLSDGNCPSCGAPLKISDRGACEYCQAIVNSGSYDWVLAEITQTSAAQRRAGAVAGLAEIAARDPGFNEQYVEDRASVIFWRLRAAELQGSPLPVRGVAAPDFLTKRHKAYEKQADGGTRFFADPAVGAVDLVSVESDVGGFDKLHVRVKWSGREVAAKLPALIKPSVRETHPFDHEFVLVRRTGVQSAKEGFAARACASCGAPETRLGGTTCSRCGSLLNTGDADWVLADVRHYSGRSVGVDVPTAAGATATGDRRVRTPDAEDAIAAAVRLVMADGRAAGREMALLGEFAAMHGIGRERLLAICQQVQNHELPAVRFITKAQRRNFLYFLIKLCVADGEITADEEAFVLSMGRKLKADDVDLPGELAKARAALQRSA